MRYLLLLAGAVGANAAGAERHERPVIAPPPAWVRPVTLPAPDPAAPDAPVQLILQDEQLDLRPERQDRYTETAFRLQTAAGLAAGNIALAWNPETQSVTVHKLHILRDGKVIDVLAGGQTFTVMRREQNLENATLDGVLTATLQPEGLQVGDIVDVAATVSTSEPVLGRHVEAVGGAWSRLPVTRAHFRAQWPAAIPMRVKVDGDLGTLRPVRQGDQAVIEFSRDRMTPVVFPAGAPPRYQVGRLVQMTDLPDWSGIAQLMAPLYAKAAVFTPSSALATEVARIRAAASDPIVRAQAAVALVQDRVRYVFLGMNSGGLVPADAETTWSRRFGDCKGKTALLLAVLHALDIEAAPAVVSAGLGDGLDGRLPMAGWFDHVLVRAAVGGNVYWLDGTRLGDRRLAGITVPPFRWALPLVANSKTLVALTPAPLDRPAVDIALTLDSRKGLRVPATAHAERVIRGDDAVTTNLQLATLTPDARDQGMREFWRGKYDFITPAKVASRFDADRREMTLTMDGEAKMEWRSGWYETDGTWVGYKADFNRDPAADRDAPFAVEFPSYTRTVETILLPPGERFTTDASISDLDQNVAGMNYRRRAAVVGDKFTVEVEARALASEFAGRDAPAAQATLRALAKRAVYLRAPDRYVATKADAEAAGADTPTSAAEWVTRGNLWLDRGELDKAMADLEQALTLEPKNSYALANRGLARAYKGDAAGAARDFDAAYAIEPRNTVVFHGRAVLGAQRSDGKTVVAESTKAIAIDPNDAFALVQRADAQHRLGDDDAALADAAAALKLRPALADMSLLRANIQRNRGDKAAAIATMKAAVAANPAGDYARVAAAKMMATLGDRAGAMALFDEALAIAPSAYIYLNRADIRPKDDEAGRLADLDAAVRLDPRWVPGLLGKAGFLARHKDLPGALALLTQAQAIVPDNPDLLIQRAGLYADSGQPAPALRDLAAARSRAKGSVHFNALCWFAATHQIGLDTALADCDAALAAAPGSSAILDSRGLVLLQLGRYADAVSTYDQALEKERIAGSLFGRAVARAKLGRTADARADLADAIKQNADVAEEFARYGITFPN